MTIPDERPATQAAAPGWYPNPTAGPRMRYWDGSRWTDSYSDHEELAAAGWYPNPYEGLDMRYWDGHQWTEHCRNDGCVMPGYGLELLRQTRNAAADVRCVECGYEGPCGVLSGRGARASKKSIAAASLMGGLVFGRAPATAYWAGAALGQASAQKSARNSTYVCPQCDAILEIY